jgi:hypothetical protein
MIMNKRLAGILLTSAAAAGPRFTHCLLDTALINLTLPGPGNTITLTLGAPTGS